MASGAQALKCLHTLWDLRLLEGEGDIMTQVCMLNAFEL